MWATFVSTIKYLGVIIRHKFFVIIAGFRVRAPLMRLLRHDMSKFSRAEFHHYRRQFCGDAGDPGGFRAAWLHHQNSNDHHWEHWMLSRRMSASESAGAEVAMPMPEGAVREMVADWMGATRAYGGKWPTVVEWDWFVDKWPSVSSKMHPSTRARVFAVMREAGYHDILKQTAESKTPVREQSEV